MKTCQFQMHYFLENISGKWKANIENKILSVYLVLKERNILKTKHPPHISNRPLPAPKFLIHHIAVKKEYTLIGISNSTSIEKKIETSGVETGP